MNVKILRQKWNKYIRSNQNIAAIIVALLAFLIIYLVLFQNPRPGVMDLVIALIGIIQFPLTVIGNSFADNTKQLYLFRVTFDIVTIIGAFFIVARVKFLLNKCTEKLIMKEKSKKKIS